MSQKSIAHRIIEAIIERLENIKTGNGFNTDAGYEVHWARRNIETESIVVWRDDESAAGSARNLTLRLEGHVDADQENTGKQLEYILADMKKAVFLNDGESRYLVKDGVSLVEDILPGSVLSAEREEGDITEAVQLLVEITFIEKYGDPYSKS